VFFFPPPLPYFISSFLYVRKKTENSCFFFYPFLFLFSSLVFVFPPVSVRCSFISLALQERGAERQERKQKEEENKGKLFAVLSGK